jgi:hypothetical protein
MSQRVSTALIVCTFIIAFLLNALIPSIAFSQGIRTIALSGQQAPSTAPGVTFASFATPTIDEVGRIKVDADLAGPGVTEDNDHAVWLEETGSLRLLVRAGDLAPGMPPGVTFENVRFAIQNDAGGIAFQTQHQGIGFPASTRSAVWTELGGTLTRVMMDGDPVPGYPSNYVARVNQGMLTNNNGEVAFRGNADDTGVINNDRIVIFSNSGGALNVALPSPFGRSFGSSSFVFSEAGHVIASVVFSIHTNRTGMMTVVAGENEPAPGTPSGVTFFTFSDRPVINALDQIAFTASLHNTPDPPNDSSGIWSEGRGQGLELVVRAGNAAPGLGGIFFGALTQPVINKEGIIAFNANLRGPGVTAANQATIWSGELGDLKLIARAGDAAPGVADGAMFQSFSRPHLNGNGMTSITALLTGPGVNASNNEGIWAQKGNGDLVLIARLGQVLDADQGAGFDLRTITALSTVGNAGDGDGRQPGFNERGFITFHARFSDGSEGIFVSTLAVVPEPHGALIASVLAMGLRLRRRIRCPS